MNNIIEAIKEAFYKQANTSTLFVIKHNMPIPLEFAEAAENQNLPFSGSKLHIEKTRDGFMSHYISNISNESKMCIIDNTGAMKPQDFVSVLYSILFSQFKSQTVIPKHEDIDFKFKHIVFSEDAGKHTIKRKLFVVSDTQTFELGVNVALTEEFYAELDYYAKSPLELYNSMFTQLQKNVYSIPAKVSVTSGTEKVNIANQTTQNPGLSAEELFLQKRQQRLQQLAETTEPEPKVVKQKTKPVKFKASLLHNRNVLAEFLDKQLHKNGVYETVNLEEFIFPLDCIDNAKIANVNSFIKNNPEFKFFYNDVGKTVFIFNKEPKLVEECENGRLVGKVISLTNPLLWIEGNTLY